MLENEDTPKVWAETLGINLNDFPIQTLTDPDPIQALNEWTKELFPDAIVINYDKEPYIFKSTEESPAIYWKVIGTEQTNKSSYAVSWFDCKIEGHIITEDVVERQRWIKAISENLSIKGEIILADESPLFINKIAVKSNTQTEGQIEILGSYGVLATSRKEFVQHKLMKADFSEVEK